MKDEREPPPLPGLELAPMGPPDLDSVLEIEHEAFSSPWRREHFLFEIQKNRWAVNQVARHAGRIVGYTSVWRIHGELKINNIAVDRDCRDRGLGRWLLQQMLCDATAAGCTVARLEVRPSNRAALRLYRAQGFYEVSRRRGYYQAEGEDAIVMEMRLRPRR